MFNSFVSATKLDMNVNQLQRIIFFFSSRKLSQIFPGFDSKYLGDRVSSHSPMREVIVAL